MKHAEHQQQLGALLLVLRDLWHPQPFHQLRPVWCAQWPELTAELLTLTDDQATFLNEDHHAALVFLTSYVPEIRALFELGALPPFPDASVRAGATAYWDWEIPGRKRQQIEAFAAATCSTGRPVLDWCGGKGHLGRLLAMNWQVPVHSLDQDATLCADGRLLAERAGVDQSFIHADAFLADEWPRCGQHAVALHACGELHRHLIRQGAVRGVEALDVAPCCYHFGVTQHYHSLSGSSELQLSRDDARLAVTETITARPRQRRQHDQAVAWKLGFDAYRRQVGDGAYRPFKPVPQCWLRAPFHDCLNWLNQREGLPAVDASSAAEFEMLGRQRRHEVNRLSIVRHAFRRAIEIWLALDLVVYLENQGYQVHCGIFCKRELTPRNLLISARRRVDGR